MKAMGLLVGSLSRAVLRLAILEMWATSAGRIAYSSVGSGDEARRNAALFTDSVQGLSPVFRALPRRNPTRRETTGPRPGTPSMRSLR